MGWGRGGWMGGGRGGGGGGRGAGGSADVCVPAAALLARTIAYRIAGRRRRRPDGAGQLAVPGGVAAAAGTGRRRAARPVAGRYAVGARRAAAGAGGRVRGGADRAWRACRDRRGERRRA